MAVVNLDGGVGTPLTVDPFAVTVNGVDTASVGGSLGTSPAPVSNSGAARTPLASATVVVGTLENAGDSVWVEADVTFASNDNEKRIELEFSAGMLAYDSTRKAQNGGKMTIMCRFTRVDGDTVRLRGDATNIADLPLFNDEPIGGELTVNLAAPIVLAIYGTGELSDDIQVTARFGWDPG